MTSDETVFTFVREHLRTVWTLELLLLLKRAPERVWSFSSLVAELRGSDAVVSNALLALKRAGVAQEQEEGWRYAPADAALDDMVERLEQGYRERPFTVIKWISASDERLRGLADAFKFKREP